MRMDNQFDILEQTLDHERQNLEKVMVKSVTKKDKETGIGVKNTPTFEKGEHTR